VSYALVMNFTKELLGFISLLATIVFNDSCRV